ncbi:MAG: DUF983 domain-containing protein [Saprospiraceae bacterium]|nr:DUF983 domain-containing protein [Saprospiraceae bacterium]
MPIFGKGSKLYSIFGFKCPKCQEGDLFETSSFSFKKPFDMLEACPNCGFKYMPEPGFYYGSMFMSYIISGWFCLFFVMFFHWVLDWSTAASFALLLGVIAVFFIWFFRFARAIWLNMVFRYDPSRKKATSVTQK